MSSPWNTRTLCEVEKVDFSTLVNEEIARKEQAGILLEGQVDDETLARILDLEINGTPEGMDEDFKIALALHTEEEQEARKSMENNKNEDPSIVPLDKIYSSNHEQVEEENLDLKIEYDEEDFDHIQAERILEEIEQQMKEQRGSQRREDDSHPTEKITINTSKSTISSSKPLSNPSSLSSRLGSLTSLNTVSGSIGNSSKAIENVSGSGRRSKRKERKREEDLLKEQMKRHYGRRNNSNPSSFDTNSTQLDLHEDKDVEYDDNDNFEDDDNNNNSYYDVDKSCEVHQEQEEAFIDVKQKTTKKGVSITGRIESSAFTTVEGVLDKHTQDLLRKIMNKGLYFSELSGIIKTGKEANIYLGFNPDDKKYYAVKIFRTTLNTFSNRSAYIDEDPRYGNMKFNRQKNRDKYKIWALKEMRNLRRIYRNQIPCPEPLDFKEHILIMSFLHNNLSRGSLNDDYKAIDSIELRLKKLVENEGDISDNNSIYTLLPSDGGGDDTTRSNQELGPDEVWPAPQLREMTLSKSLWESCYEQVIDIIFNMVYRADLVHADLSEYNLLYVNRRVHVIDVGQAVHMGHANAVEFLRKDIYNVNKFFKRKGVKVLSDDDLFNYAIICGQMKTKYKVAQRKLQKTKKRYEKKDMQALQEIDDEFEDESLFEMGMKMNSTTKAATRKRKTKEKKERKAGKEKKNVRESFKEDEKEKQEQNGDKEHDNKSNKDEDDEDNREDEDKFQIGKEGFDDDNNNHNDDEEDDGDDDDNDDDYDDDYNDDDDDDDDNDDDEYEDKDEDEDNDDNDKGMTQNEDVDSEYSSDKNDEDRAYDVEYYKATLEVIYRLRYGKVSPVYDMIQQSQLAEEIEGTEESVDVHVTNNGSDQSKRTNGIDKSNTNANMYANTSSGSSNKVIQSKYSSSSTDNGHEDEMNEERFPLPKPPKKITNFAEATIGTIFHGCSLEDITGMV